MVGSGTLWQKVGDGMLMGEFHHNIDDKNRLVVPTNFRKELKESFVITRGLEKCLYAYSMDEWNKLVNKINELPFTKKDTRIFTRTFFSGAAVCEFDKNGRITITSQLVSYADLSKTCAIIGVNDHLEIWNEDIFNDYMNQNADSIEDIAEHLFEITSL